MAFKAFTTTKVRKQLSAARKRNEGTKTRPKKDSSEKKISFIQNSSFLATISEIVPIYRKMKVTKNETFLLCEFFRMNEKSLEVDILAYTIFFKNNNNFSKKSKSFFMSRRPFLIGHKRLPLSSLLVCTVTTLLLWK